MPAKPGVLTAGPFSHMVYNGDPFRNEPGACYLATNMRPLDPENGGPYVRRYGDYQYSPTNATTPQWVGVYRKRSGFLNVIIQDGEILSATVAAGGWTKVVTAANIVTAGATLSAAALIYAITYNNYLIINDGVNQPIAWDGTAGAGGITVLVNAPAKCYGAPTVLASKLFLIKDVAANSADRSTMVWSEENAFTGFEAGGFNNAWTIEQQGAGPLYALYGTNEGLYYFRANSIGLIRGAVTTDFSTSATRDNVSGSVGTVSPGGVTLAENGLWFVDSRGYPYYLPLGGNPIPLWQDIADFLLPLDQYTASAPLFQGSDLAAFQVTSVPYVRGVLFSYRKLGVGYAIDHYLYHSGTHRAMAKWTFANNGYRIGEFWDDVASLGGVWSVSAGAPGQAIMNPAPNNQPRYNTTSTYDAVLGRQFIARPLGVEVPSVLWRWKEMTIEFDVGGNPTPGNGTITPSVGTSERLNFNSSDFATLTATALSAVTERVTLRRTFGINRELRWFTPRVDASNDLSLGGWGVSRITCAVDPIPAHPAKS